MIRGDVKRLLQINP